MFGILFLFISSIITFNAKDLPLPDPPNKPICGNCFSLTKSNIKGTPVCFTILSPLNIGEMFLYLSGSQLCIPSVPLMFPNTKPVSISVWNNNGFNCSNVGYFILANAFIG